MAAESIPPSAWSSRLPALLITALFALAFTAGGLWAGVLPLARTAGMVWAVQSWVPVQAKMLDVALESRRGSKGATTYEVTALYTYQLHGRTFESRRVGLDLPGHSDNVGNWHQRWYEALRQARDGDGVLPAWANPAQPEQALIDRQVRWSMVAFRLPFAFIFTGVGLLAAWAFFSLLLGGRLPADAFLARFAVKGRTSGKAPRAG